MKGWWIHFPPFILDLSQIYSRLEISSPVISTSVYLVTPTPAFAHRVNDGTNGDF